MGSLLDIRARALVGVALVALVGTGCDRGSDEDDSRSSSAREPSDDTGRTVQSFEPPDAVDLVEPPSERRRELDLGEPLRYPACRDIFESGGEVRSTFLPDRDRKEWVVYGCKPEAYRRLEDGRRYIAYRPEAGGPGRRDLRLVAYGPDGSLSWSYLLRRSDYTENFTANFRSSFITPLLPHLVCVGTLWAGDTQLSCLDAESGEPEWEGDLGFWSGPRLRGHDVALHGADITGFTRRYPYSGVEMERTEFEFDGGHGALYVSDEQRLYFASDEEERSRMTAYDFATMEPVWRTELPDRPDPGYDEGAIARHDLVAIKIAATLYGFDAASGSVRWAFEIGDGRPALAAGPESLYMLVQRPERPSLVYSVAPDTGSLEWYAPVPTGTLEIAWVDETLLVRSVRAFQPVRGDL